MSKVAVLTSDQKLDLEHALFIMLDMLLLESLS